MENLINELYEGQPTQIDTGDEPQFFATKWQFYWLCALILSFCYERPLVEFTSMDRLNPRLFDGVFFIGLLFILPSLQYKLATPGNFKIWKIIIFIFMFCAFVWFPFFPFYYGKYTIFIALKYLQGLIAIYIATQIPITS